MRVRFAPSPTGALHIGGARTALYNWLLARGPASGVLVLRIEDTDRERSTAENVDQILDALTWLGLNWDEGPLMQSERAPRHAEMLERVLASGHAYRSSATAEDVKRFKAEHGQDRGFRGEPEATGAVRLRVPHDQATTFDDVVLGLTSFPNRALDDPVIARADGTVVYNFAVAVDDHDAGITHVVRGADHISNTPKQLWVLAALGVEAPRYAHLPLLHGPDGKKLSKRHGAASVQELREAGYLPEAVSNYLALLGAGFSADQDHFSAQELAQRFRLERVSRNPAIFDEQKLRHMNGRHLRELTVDELTERLERYTGHLGLRGAVEISREKIQTLADFWPLAGFIFDGPAEDEKAFAKHIATTGGPERLSAAREAIATAPEPFTAQALESPLAEVVQRLSVKPGQVYQPIRVALAGVPVSPGIFETLALLGRAESLRRIDRALARAAS